jgi:hypothetical protein
MKLPSLLLLLRNGGVMHQMQVVLVMVRECD